MTLSITPIGTVVGGRDEAFDDHWGTVTAAIELDSDQFSPEALAGLADFSHLEVVYHFHLVPEEKVETGARHPRNRQDWPLVGIFAQRGKNRPNRIGVSRCRLLEVSGLTVRVAELDAIDGTPVLDIKPYMSEFGPRGEIVQPLWSKELMGEYY
ncbi:SAM-dependent methyltransferase [Streptacidiphilus sp. N1-10]|uniref:SAM-dependent methyltransferase n=1 Tax=Streptacidiphilus jeojiensis TaxID=3229225 RepID=A0ABV6XFJ2_9ACTN